MESKDYRKLLALAKHPFKIVGSVTTGNGAATLYYVKPSVPCKLIGAKLNVITASGANLGSAALLTKETGVTDKDLPYGKITISTNITAGSAVSNDDFMQFAVASVATAKVTVAGLPQANFLGTENNFDPKLNDALLILFPATSNATLMVGSLELEFLPL